MTSARILVVGTGSIARRHLTNVRLVSPGCQVGVLRRAGSGTSEGELRLLADVVFSDIEEAVEWDPWAAVVANPATVHVAVGRRLAEEGVHLLIEKPMAATLDGVDDLIDCCAKREITLMVGYNLRFDPLLQAAKELLDDGHIGSLLTVRAEVGQYLPDWRPQADYRSGVTAQRALGGGVVLELSHELHYVRWLVGEIDAVAAQLATVGDLDVDVEDTAEISIRFANGVLGNVHLDMVQRVPVRRLAVAGTDGTLVWDGIAGSARVWTTTAPEWRDLVSGPTNDRGDTYVRELEHFFMCAAEGMPPLVSGDDGRRLVELSVAVKRSAAEQRTVEVPVRSGGLDADR